MPTITIDTDLILRPLREANADELFQLVDTNRDHLREWLPWLDANTSPEHSRQFILRAQRQEADNLGPTYAIILHESIGVVVGYHPIQWKNRSVEIGYWLGHAVTGQGIMTRCCRVLIDYAFGELDLNRVNIPAAVGNARSRAIPERLGFKQEGMTKDAEWLYDHYVDHIRYAMLRQDWPTEESGDLVKPAPEE